MIDDLARELTRPMPRRRALRLLGGAVAVAVVPGLRVPVAAAASCGALGCSGKCCSSTDWMKPGLQGVCCDVSETCCGPMANPGDPDHMYGWCCGEGYDCGEEFDTCKAVCKAPKFECGEDCCDEGAACCPVNDGEPMCCPDGEDCVKQITQGNVGITPDSPYVCCPPERLVTALTVSKICCPPGSVRQPGGGLSTAGGFCCTSGKVCGSTCCDSTPSFPKECIDGKRCEFEFLRVEQEKVKAERDGTVKVPLKLDRPASATLSVVMAGGGGGKASAAAAKPVVLGRKKVSVGRPGRKAVRIKLSRRGRKRLRKHGKLRVEVIVAVRDAAGKAETATPVTLRARGRA